eukprot:15469585-Alexandrium_andersonii.AAC.1
MELCQRRSRRCCSRPASERQTSAAATPVHKVRAGSNRAGAVKQPRVLLSGRVWCVCVCAAVRQPRHAVEARAGDRRRRRNAVQLQQQLCTSTSAAGLSHGGQPRAARSN